MAVKSVLGGDDVRSIVADCGTWVLRLGSSGDDTPRSVMPAVIGHKHQKNPDAMTDEDNKSSQSKPDAGDKVLISPQHFRDVVPIHQITPDDITIDWDAMQIAWQAACDNLRLSFQDSPFLIVEPVRGWPQADRSKALERAFEGCSVPAAYLGRGSAMCAFASARTTACVLDIGYQGACAAPVIDGYPLLKRVETSVVGGKYLSARLQEWAESVLDERSNYDGSERKSRQSQDPDVKPTDWLRAHHELKKERIMLDDVVRRYKVSDLSGIPPLQNSTTAHKNFYRLRVMDEMKASSFRIAQHRSSDVNGKDANGKEGPKSNSGEGKAEDGKEKEKEGGAKEAKDGKDKGKEKSGPWRSSDFVLPDGNSLSLEENNGLDIANSLFTTNPDLGMASMTDLVFKSVSDCDVDLRRDLFGGVVITGGTSMITGVVERVTRELAIVMPQAYKLKLVAPTNSIERTCASWIGGSIVSSLGTFQQAWISKAEYEELGSTNALRKCP